MTDPKLQTTADLAQQLRDVIPPAPHFLAMLEELERRAECRDLQDFLLIPVPNEKDRPSSQATQCIGKVMQYFGSILSNRGRLEVLAWFEDYCGAQPRERA